MTNKIEILTPVGRLVQGTPFVSYDKDMEGRPLTDKNGNPRVKYFMALAVPKTDPHIIAVLQKITDTARVAFPSKFDTAGNCTDPAFAFKFIDGDTKPEKEGFAGCYVLNFSGGFAPKCFTRGGDSVITDPEAIKRGYYIRIYGNVVGNNSTARPGVFLNPNLVEFVGYGQEIVGGVDTGDVFGSIPAVPPLDASDTPLAPPIPISVAPVSVAPVAPAAPAAPAAPVSVAPVSVQPHPGFLNPATGLPQ